MIAILIGAFFVSTAFSHEADAMKEKMMLKSENSKLMHMIEEAVGQINYESSASITNTVNAGSSASASNFNSDNDVITNVAINVVAASSSSSSESEECEDDPNFETSRGSTCSELRTKYADKGKECGTHKLWYKCCETCTELEELANPKTDSNEGSSSCDGGFCVQDGFETCDCSGGYCVQECTHCDCAAGGCDQEGCTETCKCDKGLCAQAGCSSCECKGGFCDQTGCDSKSCEGGWCATSASGASKGERIAALRNAKLKQTNQALREALENLE